MTRYALPGSAGVSPASSPPRLRIFQDCRGRLARSADFQSAVSQVCNLLALRRNRSTVEVENHQRPGRLPIANRRYSRLKICATPSGGLRLYATHTTGGRFVSARTIASNLLKIASSDLAFTASA